MLLLSVLCAAAAVLLLIPAPAARRLARRLAAADVSGAGRARRKRPWALIVGGSLAGAIAGGIVLGVAAGLLVGTGAAVALVVARLVQLRGRRRAAARARADVAHACRVLAGQVRVGRVPAEALRVTALDCPVLAPAAAGVALGGEPTALWQAAARGRGYGGLLLLAQAWRVSTNAGAALAPALEQVSDALTRDLAVQRLVASEVSAARATGKVMAALPTCGIAIGYAIGGRPLQFMLSGPLGWLCLVGGVALALAGVAWIDWLAGRASEQE
jgi:tight adherence protein B